MDRQMQAPKPDLSSGVIMGMGCSEMKPPGPDSQLDIGLRRKL